jgi:hypothetical protein
MVPQTMQQWLQQQWNNGALTRPQVAVMALLQNPEDFLRKYPILNTFDCQNSGVSRAYLRNGSNDAFRPGSKLGTLNMHRTESFNLESVTGHNADGYEFPVHGVFTGPGDQPPAWYRLDATGPAMMLTAKLTGCTFVVRASYGGGIEVTHLQPNQNIDGITLNTNMRTGGNSAYGRLRYDIDVRSINVIGVRHGNNWQIWAQKLEKNSNPPRLLSLNRIWPV